MLTAATQERQLEPRYRRVLSFGDVLDESISLYRRHWLTYALVSAIWLLPPGLIMVWFSTVGLLQTSSVLAGIQVGQAVSAAQIEQLLSALGMLAVTELVWVLFWLAYTAAIVVTTDSYMNGSEARLGEILGRTLRAYVPVLLGGCLFVLGLGVLFVAATLIVLVPIVDVLLLLAALIGVVVWWLQPAPKSTWLKWLVIIGFPWGLPTYFSIVWSMFLVAIIAERRGPIDSIRRSAQLVYGQWFRVFGILTVAWTIVVVLQFAPSALIQLPLMISAFARGQVTLGTVEQAASMAVGVISQVLFGSVAPIAYTLIFIDLRNRREGADIAERLSQLEAREPTAVHA